MMSAWIVFQLIRADLRAFREVALSDTIDLLIWVSVVTLINGYLLPLFGVPKEFVLLSFSGTVASGISFRTFPMIYNLVTDLHGDRQIAQKLILPIHPVLIFLAMTLSSFLISLFVSVWVLPLGVLLLWQLFPAFSVSIGHFVAAWFVSALFFCVFSIWVASFVKAPNQMGKVFIRFMFPLWFFGGLQFTWAKLHEAAPFLSYLDLINPYVYAMESMRTALLGPEGNLDFTLCLGMLLLLMIVTFAHAFWRFKKQLDFI